MKKTFTLLLVLLAYTSSFAQTHNIAAAFKGGLAFYTFTNNNLVSDRKKLRSGSGSMISYGLSYAFTNKQHISFGTGINFSNHFMTIRGGNKFRLFGGLNVVDSFYVPTILDTVHIATLDLTYKTITIPTTYTKTLYVSNSRKAFFQLGVSLNHHFFIANKSTIELDNRFTPPRAGSTALAGTAYKGVANKYILSIEPIANFGATIGKNVAFHISLLPFEYYTNSWYKRITSNPTVIQFNTKLIVKL